MTTIGYINIALETFGALLSLIFIICLATYRRKDRMERLYIRVLGLNAVVLICDAAAWIFKGRMAPFSFYAVRIANFFVFAFGYVLLSAFTDYLICLISSKGEDISKRPAKLMWYFTALAVVLVILSQFNHMYYIIDDKNFYHRQDWFWLSQMFGIVCMLINGFILYRHREKLERKEIIAIGSYILMPVIAMAIQMFIYGIAILYLATTISAMCIYISIQVEQSREFAIKELELAKSRSALMVGQIQPHFLYNALNTIHYLCRTQPDKAADVVESFSLYLRGNMDSLTQQHPIPFKQELIHLERFLVIELLRFPFVRIEYDLKEENFSLPPLTLQPLVENAIRYGVSKKDEERATVKVSTWREGENCYLMVSDKGSGFDRNKISPGSRSHIGLSNTQKRLEMLCKGSLKIESAPGEGTKVIITIQDKGGNVQKYRDT